VVTRWCHGLWASVIKPKPSIPEWPRMFRLRSNRFPKWDTLQNLDGIKVA